MKRNWPRPAAVRISIKWNSSTATQLTSARSPHVKLGWRGFQQYNTQPELENLFENPLALMPTLCAPKQIRAKELLRDTRAFKGAAYRNVSAALKPQNAFLTQLKIYLSQWACLDDGMMTRTKICSKDSFLDGGQVTRPIVSVGAHGTKVSKRTEV